VGVSPEFAGKQAPANIGDSGITPKDLCFRKYPSNIVLLSAAASRVFSENFHYGEW
jgi:hypothetical protein